MVLEHGKGRGRKRSERKGWERIEGKGRDGVDVKGRTSKPKVWLWP